MERRRRRVPSSALPPLQKQTCFIIDAPHPEHALLDEEDDDDDNAYRHLSRIQYQSKYVASIFDAPVTPSDMKAISKHPIAIVSIEYDEDVHQGRILEQSPPSDTYITIGFRVLTNPEIAQEFCEYVGCHSNSEITIGNSGQTREILDVLETVDIPNDVEFSETVESPKTTVRLIAVECPEIVAAPETTETQETVTTQRSISTQETVETPFTDETDVKIVAPVTIETPKTGDRRRETAANSYVPLSDVGALYGSESPPTVAKDRRADGETDLLVNSPQRKAEPPSEAVEFDYTNRFANAQPDRSDEYVDHCRIRAFAVTVVP